MENKKKYILGLIAFLILAGLFGYFEIEKFKSAPQRNYDAAKQAVARSDKNFVFHADIVKIDPRDGSITARVKTVHSFAKDFPVVFKPGDAFHFILSASTTAYRLEMPPAANLKDFAADPGKYIKPVPVKDLKVNYSVDFYVLLTDAEGKTNNFPVTKIQINN